MHQICKLMQFFNEFFSLLKSFRNQRNHSYLMTLHRKSTKLKGLDSTLQQNHVYATLYAFAYIKCQWELSRTLDNVTSAPSWKAWDFHTNICLKNVHRKRKNFFTSSFLKTSGHSDIIAHLALKDFLKSLHQPRWSRKFPVGWWFSWRRF